MEKKNKIKRIISEKRIENIVIICLAKYAAQSSICNNVKKRGFKKIARKFESIPQLIYLISRTLWWKQSFPVTKKSCRPTIPDVFGLKLSIFFGDQGHFLHFWTWRHFSVAKFNSNGRMSTEFLDEGCRQKKSNSGCAIGNKIKKFYKFSKEAIVGATCKQKVTFRRTILIVCVQRNYNYSIPKVQNLKSIEKGF